MIQLSNSPRIYPRLNDRGLFLGEVRMAPGPPRRLGQQDPVTDLLVHGAILQASVSSPAAYAQAGGASPPPQTFTAMIDTGASISCINIGSAQQLGLQQVSSTQLGGVGGSSEAPIYAAAVTLPKFGVTVDPVQIAGVGNPLPGVDMLIGRDILKSLHLDWHGGQGVFTLSNEDVSPNTQISTTAAPPTPGTVSQPGVAPQGNLPQPPPQSTILGMKPLVAIGAGVGALALVGGALFLFKVF